MSSNLAEVERLSEVLSCVHFPIAAGLTPSIQELHDAVDRVTVDWTEGAVDKGQPVAPEAPSASQAAPKLRESPEVRAAVTRLWAQFEKDKTNSVAREEYEGFLLRVMRVLLPGLGSERETRLAANAWEEDAGGMERLTFAQFFDAMIRLAKVWTDWKAPDHAAAFLDDMLQRTTYVIITLGDTGEVIRKAPNIMATFWTHHEILQTSIPECEFGAVCTLGFKGQVPEFEVSCNFSISAAFVQMGSHLCWFDESVVAPEDDAAPNDGIRREWLELDDVVPIGRTALVALQKAQAETTIMVNASTLSPVPQTMIEATCGYIQASAGIEGGRCNVEVANLSSIAEARAVLMPSGQPFGIRQLLAVGLRADTSANLLFIRPALRSPLYKLRKLREELGLEQISSAEAAIPGGAVTGDPHGPKLPTFTDLLENKVAYDPEMKIVQPVKNESILMTGTLASLAEAFIYDGPDNRLGSSSQKEETSVVAEMSAQRQKRGQKYFSESDFTTRFPTRAEGLRNDETDLLSLATTPPVTLWVLGQCDALGEYKTEVCRRLADKLGLQWLRPQHLLEMAVKTPEEFRSKLMARCVEQLQRGMVVPTSDALRLALELMSSAKCTTNGYILDFPQLVPSDMEAVGQFIERVRAVSSKAELRKQEFLRDDVRLEKLSDEPEPPKPPPDPEAEGDAEGGEGEGEAAAEEAAEPAPAADVEATAEGAAAGDAEENAEGVDDEANADDAKEPEPEEDPVPNPWANVMPRRVVALTMGNDELAAWRLALLKARHEKYQRTRQELADAGEEPEEEEEEPVPELPELPAEEEELKELFASKGDDVLLTMEQFIPVPSLQAPDVTKKPPPVRDTSAELKVEEVNASQFIEGENAVIKTLHLARGVPMLKLHADGRSPETMAALLEKVCGQFPGPRVALPQPIEGAADMGDACELLVIDEKKASRRWSMWKQHCPVSLYDKCLKPGQKEFAVDYAGNCLLFADEKCQRRFCTWPKIFLSEAPRINAPGMALGYVLLSPCGYRAQNLAERLRAIYDFDIINVSQLLETAMNERAIDEPDYEPAEGDLLEGEEPLPQKPPLPEDFPGLTMEEQKDLRQGKAILSATIVRLIGVALRIDKNIALVAERKELIEKAKAELEAAADDPEKLEALEFPVNEGEPVFEPLVPLTPKKGFVLVGHPESADQLASVHENLQIQLERILILKKESDEAPEIEDILGGEGFRDQMPLGPVLEKYGENIDTLERVETPAREEIPLEVDEHSQLVIICKKIDPFYPVVEDPSVGIAIPDPTEFDMATAVEAAKALEEETGEKQDTPMPPVIPWGLCGPYCPVTLTEDCWLYPGTKELQNVFRNRVYSLASEAVLTKFTAEPIKYIPTREPILPPPRVLIIGPTGSGVDEQCKLLSDAYGIPVLELEPEWRKRVDQRIEVVKQANRAKAAVEKLQEPMMLDDGPAWPEGWTLPVEKTEDEDEGDAPAEEEPEEDGLDDEQREELIVEAMRDVLGRHIGACVINGKFDGSSFGEVSADAEADPTRSLHNLLIKARRLPDLTIMLKVKHDVAARNVYNFEEIDAKYDQDLAEYEALVKEVEDRNVILADNGEDEDEIPNPPDHLVLDAEEGEKESDRVKATFIEKKMAQQADLQASVEAILEARAPLQKVPADRGSAVAHKSIRWHCRPFMEQRASLLVKHQAKQLTPSMATDVLERALVQPSYFRNNSPMFADVPLFAGRPDAFKCPVELRGRCFYPRSAAEQEQFLARPQDFVHLPPPSPIVVNPCICVCGPPLSGKTALTKLLAERTGAVYLSVPEILNQLCDGLALQSELSRDIVSCMRKGKKIPTGRLVEAIRHRMSAPDVLTRGWILDDFPITVEQAEALTDAGIVPHRLLILSIPQAIVFQRAAMIASQGAGGYDNLVQQEVSIQRNRLESHARSLPLVHSYYSLTFSNVCEIDGSKSMWANEDRAVEETSSSISQRLEYYRRTSEGRAACVYGVGFSAGRIEKNMDAWRKYCPVTLTLGNELVQCKDPRFVVEYKTRIYWMASQEYMRLFLNDPESFLAVPLPASTPQLLSLADRVPQPNCMLEEDGTAFCPVALVDRKELVKAVGCYVVQHQGKFWSLENKKACEKFMRRPMRYVQRAKLPAKKPALPGKDYVALLTALQQGGGKNAKGLDPGEMLTFMQASVAEMICQAMVESGERRPLFPGKSAQESALLFLAKFLRAKNVLNTAMTAADFKGQLDEFISDCAVPNALKEITRRKEAHQTMQEGAWTASDCHQYKELCDRFDTLFAMSPDFALRLP